MTITPNKVRTQLQASTVLLDNLTVRLVTATVNAKLAQTDPAGPADKPRAEDAGIRGKGGHGDPTADAAIRGIGWDDRVFDDLEAHLATLKLSLALLTMFADDWAPNLGNRARCAGGRTVDEWSDPTCQNWAGDGGSKGWGWRCTRCARSRENEFGDESGVRD